jgi:type IV pilus assembly protein PilC
MKKNKDIIIGGVSLKELALLIRQLYAAVKSGYNSAQALDLAYSQSRGRLKWILDTVIEEVGHGAYLYESFGKFEKYFPPLFLNLIKTGELSGSLKENLQRLLDIIQKEIEIRHKIRSAMAYPAFVLLAVVGLGLAVAFFVLPNLLPLFTSLDVELPLSTRILMWFAEIFDAHGTAILLGFFGGVIALTILATRRFARPAVHWLMLRFPLVGSVTRRLAMARFGRSLASLSRSGIPINESLAITGTIIGNCHYQRVIESILPMIEKGQTFSAALEQYPRYFDDIFVRLLALGEATAGLEEACDNVADYYETEVNEAMRNLTVSLEPILIIFVGLIVAFVAFSILGPIYKITGNLR